MADAVPIACTLTAAEMSKRLAEMRAIGAEALRSVDTSGAAAVLRFHSSSMTRERLEAIVAAEATCCAFLDLDLAKASALVLTIHGPEGGEPVMHELVAAFSGESPAAA